ncbi:MAG: hypothetical protein QOE05_2623 [Actinomycetota bacterium]|nr:hypothetical protein [Actinomycetota bacterium]
MSRRLRPARPAIAVLLGLLGALTVSVVPAAAAPVTRMPSKAIEVLSPYQAQSTCNPAPKPGTLALSKLVMAAYPGSGTSGISRDCSIGGRSEHKEGRAWDWHVVYTNTKQRAQAADFAHWLFATDAYGNRFAQARRLGVQYVIWNHKIWSSYNSGAGWRPYTGADPHTSHMHISLSWAGALKKTSYWTGAVSPVLRAPGSPAVPAAPAAPIEPPAKDLFPTNDPDSNHSWDGRDAPSTAPTGPRPVYNPDHLPVLAVGEGGVDVSATDDGLSTPFLLLGGKDYLLTVTGTYVYGADPMQADAECSRWPRDRNWHRATQWESSGSNGGLDLTINGRATSWSPMVQDERGCDSTTHTYTTVVKPRYDGTLRFALRDDNRKDNSGSLHVVVRPLDASASND